jgi:hypothetical protein
MAIISNMHSTHIACIAIQAADHRDFFNTHSPYRKLPGARNPAAVTYDMAISRQLQRLVSFPHPFPPVKRTDEENELAGLRLRCCFPTGILSRYPVLNRVGESVHVRIDV